MQRCCIVVTFAAEMLVRGSHEEEQRCTGQHIAKNYGKFLLPSDMQHMFFSCVNVDAILVYFNFFYFFLQILGGNRSLTNETSQSPPRDGKFHVY